MREGGKEKRREEKSEGGREGGLEEERPLGMAPSGASDAYAACLLRPCDPARWVKGYDCRLTYRREWEDES